MVQKTVMKVQVCEKGKKKILKSVSSLQGVDKIEIDMGKGTLTVIGDADPCEIIMKTRKVVKCAQVVTIGPPPPPPPAKKPECNIKPCVFPPPLNCSSYNCQPMAVLHMNQPEPYCTTCTIM